MLLFSTTEQSLPNDMINHITDFLTTGLFVLDGLCKSSQNLEDKQNPNVMKLPSIESFLQVKQHHELNFELDLFESNTTDVSMLDGIHTVHLCLCYDLTNGSALRYSHTVCLSITDVTDVSMLGDVHTLYLAGCSNITDVSKLGGVHTLDLSDCDGITDVSDLGGVRNLNLTGCHNITDFSMLGKDGQKLIR
jgi:hypothetical protein